MKIDCLKNEKMTIRNYVNFINNSSSLGNKD